MANDIVREKVKALVKVWESDDLGVYEANIAIKELKVLLRPSKEEIADKLEAHAFSNVDNVQEMIDYAIEELRGTDK